MKKQFYLLPLLLLLVSAFTSPAFARTHRGGGTALPINSAVLYLAIAGLAVGLIAIYKFRSAVAVKEA